MSWEDACDTVCPVARALAVVGDRWTMLLMRELSGGPQRFDDMQAQTGMSSHLLSTRLKRMESDGVIERRLYNERPPRYEYCVTQKGKELEPLLIMLRSWGLKWGGFAPGEEPAVTFVHKASGEVAGGGWYPPGQKPLMLDDFERSMNPAFRAEREARRKAFQAAKKAT
jgi:DNA-binding HxlR family transcriptional regulator